jgi:hypothetical protein
MEKLFGLNKTITYIIIFVSLLFVYGAFKQIFRNVGRKQHYLIEPENGYPKIGVDLEFKDNCCIFLGERGPDKVCGKFKITKI